MATTLKITPTEFTASSGKLTSTRRYMRKVSAGYDLRFVVGQNMDVRGGGLRYIRPDSGVVDDSSYSSSFSGSTVIGVKV